MTVTIARSHTCGRCNRPLTSEASLAAGFGPICLAKLDRDSGTWEAEGYEYLAGLAGCGEVVLRRGKGGGIAGNVPWLHRHHSPGGFEWGYAGSGPADLALNLAAYIAPHAPEFGEGIKLHDGTSVSPLAWAMHQDLKFRFIAPLDRDADEVRIDGAAVDAWASEFAQVWAKQSYLALVTPEVIVLRRLAPLAHAGPVASESLV